MKGRRWPALDGLRGVAILLVFAFHLPFKTFLAGSYGVVLFFVISGFLITTILLREVDANGRVDFGGFYTRRAQRLLPALGLVIIGHLILQITVLGQPGEWWGRTWPVLAYVANYAAMAGNNLVHMSHTWSLAIEEHFYLVWPAILVAIPSRWRWRTTAALASAFLAWRLGLLWAGASDLRVYFGTDTNAYAPLIGCALAVAHHEGRLRKAGKNVAALATACLLAAASMPLDFHDRRLMWGAPAFALLSAVAIYGAVTAPAPLLELPLIRWFGKISYGLYLWHYMLISLPWERWPIPPALGMVGLPILIAWASWTYVEEPILHRRKRIRALATAPEPLPTPATP